MQFIKITYHLTILLLLLSASSSYAQTEGIYNKAESITIKNGSSLFVRGTFINDDNPNKIQQQNGEVNNAGTIYLSGNLINDGESKVFNYNTNGKVVFVGGIIQLIRGDTSIEFSNVKINKSDSMIILLNNPVVHDTLEMTFGNIDLNGYTLELKDNLGPGLLSGENEDSRIFGDSGVILTTRTFSSNENIGGLGLQLNTGNNNGFGMTRLERGHWKLPQVGDSSIQRHYNLTPLNGDTASVRLAYLNAELESADESDLDLFITNDSISWFPQFAGVDINTNDALKDSVLLNRSTITLSRSCSFNIQINNKDTVSLCGKDSIILLTGSVENHYWSTGAETNFTWANSAGTYSVTVIDKRGCVGRDTIVILDSPLPDPGFVIEERLQCNGNDFRFADTTLIASGNISSIIWDFGDTSSTVSTSAGDTVTHQYKEPGKFIVTALATSQYGCVDSISDWVRIHPNPDADFIATTDNCADSSIVFNDSSKVDSLIEGAVYAITNYTYYFGDGDSANVPSPAHAYTSVDTFLVKQIVRTNTGCADTLTDSIRIYENPMAMFTADTTCSNLPMQFVNNSSFSDSVVFTWDLGDSTLSSDTSLTYQYTNPGVYSVNLTVTTIHQCTDIYHKEVVASIAPLADFDVALACAGQDLQFTNNSGNIVGETIYKWHFGDGSSDTLFNSSHTYPLPGIFEAKLVVINPNGCSDTIDNLLRVHSTPSASFTANDTCLEKAVRFINTSTISSGILSYSWDLGDGNISTLTDPEHFYSDTGTYTVELTATSEQGCKNNFTGANITIHPLPDVDFGDRISTCGNKYLLNAGNPGGTFQWQDGSKADTFLVTTSGNYWVTVTSQLGCSASDTVDVGLQEEFIISLGPDTVSCDNKVLDPDIPFSSYVWSTGDNTKEITVTTSGSYWVEVIDQNDCIDSDTISVKIMKSPQISLGSQVQACFGEIVTLQPDTIHPVLLWSTGDTAQSIITDTSGTYWLKATASNGCSGSDTTMVTFHQLPYINLGADTSVCDEITLKISNDQILATWNNGTTNQMLLVNSSGEYWANVLDSNNCSNSDTIKVTVNASPEIDLGKDTLLCNADTLTYSFPAGDKYNWSTGSDSNQIALYLTGEYWVEVKDSNNCNNTDTIRIIADREKITYFDDTLFICKENNITLNTGITKGSFRWFDGDGLISSDGSVNLSDSGFYQVEIITEKGCSYSDAFYLQRSLNPVSAEFLVATTVNLGDMVQFVNVAMDPKEVQYHWNFGDGITSTAEHPEHIFLADGTYNVTLAVNDAYCNDTLSKIITVLPLRQSPPDTLQEKAFVSPEIINTLFYPNPGKGSATLEIKLKRAAPLTYRIFDINGKIIESETITGSEFIITIDITEQEPGIYVLQLITDSDQRSLKIVKL